MEGRIYGKAVSRGFVCVETHFYVFPHKRSVADESVRITA